ncbi:MAG: preprotein translocase subunit SecE [Candidatus Kerfeldbacteria bacterium]|nr:preprotein translocase subunit SecE [Candidatus Kerfeldbacteria bacterium]
MAFSLPAYFKESIAELRKVAWPTRQATIKSTGIVLLFTASTAIFLGVIDYLFTLGLNYLIDLA